MNNKKFNLYHYISCIVTLIVSYYPLSMGINVIVDMITDGIVIKENYPKYIIPYTPISIAIIIGVFMMPLFIKLFKKWAFTGAIVLSTSFFFLAEFLFEEKIIIDISESVTKLEAWQMLTCYVPPTINPLKNKTAVDILMGDYSPAFKLHFYLISVVLIITILNCIYGFGQIIKNGEKKRFKSLVIQSICSTVFLGLCILACFTAFWRDGSIQVSYISALLMSVFFILLGTTTGVFIGSLFLGKRKLISVFIPSFIAVIITFLMYVGEMILLNGHLYRFGTGILFDAIPSLILAPIDLLIIVVSGILTALIFVFLNSKYKVTHSNN